jgi:Fic family protein
LPWWTDGEGLEEFVAQIQRGHSYKEADAGDYQATSHILVVYISNKMERTLPDTIKQGVTYQMLADIRENPDGYKQEDIRWSAEGSMDVVETRQQLAMHMKALMHMLMYGELTVELIKETHGILMCGAVDEEHRPVLAGLLREGPAHNGAGLVYADARDVERMLEGCIREFNEALSAAVSDEVESCRIVARLLHVFLFIHPFENGNGRMGRLLVCWALRCLGAPFLVPLTNGHSKNRSHYMQCLRAADRGDLNKLTAYVLECYARSCYHFVLRVEMKKKYIV